MFWALFCYFHLFPLIFCYFYPKFNQFRDFLSYLQLLSVWDLSQLFSTQFRPYPNFWGLTLNFSVLGTFLLFSCFPLIFVIFTQNLTKFVTFRLTPSFLVSGTFPNYFLPNLGLTPNFWGLTFNFSVLGTFLLFSFFPLIFVIFTQNLTNFVTFCLTPNFLVSGTFPNYFLPNLGLTPIFWGLTLNFSVLGTFLLFSSFSPNF